MVYLFCIYCNKLTDWIIVGEFCATRVLESTDINDVRNIVAFIDKTLRVRVESFTEVDDFKNWKLGYKGTDGMDKEIRYWCDDELLKLRYEF
jgi:hypothetical protein